MANLKKMLTSGKPIVIPGVYDAIGAKIAEKNRNVNVTG